MANLDSMQFQQEFRADEKIICNDLKTVNAILSDVAGFIEKHKLKLVITKHNTYTTISGKGIIESECVVMINDYGISQINTYYNEVEVTSKEITWKNLRRCLITMINCS